MNELLVECGSLKFLFIILKNILKCFLKLNYLVMNFLIVKSWINIYKVVNFIRIIC